MSTASQIQMQVDFHEMANNAFIFRYNNFEKESFLINRQTNEYQFQELKIKYVHSLEHDLQDGAQSILQKNHHSKQVNELGQLFHHLITDYLHRFVQKINAS